MSRRNASMIGEHNSTNAYDWWWHSLVARNTRTGDRQPFFIEYYVVNPGLGGAEPVFGQIPGDPGRPSYAMIKAGAWGRDKAQIHNFYGIDSYRASRTGMNVRIGGHYANESELRGSVSLSSSEADAHPEYMSDAGQMSWDLKAEKVISYSVGYGASAPFRRLGLFDMFWHVQGMKTRYTGTISYNGSDYEVQPESSCGYQDKNWGRDYTNPWIWLNCNCFENPDGGSEDSASLVVGGGNPRVAGMSLGEKILVAFGYRGQLYEFNFTRLLFQRQEWHCRIENDYVFWEVDVSNRTHRLTSFFSCPVESMILVNYENPAGVKNHTQLWNGGHASGTVRLTERRTGTTICRLTGEFGGCEYGRY